MIVLVYMEKIGPLQLNATSCQEAILLGAAVQRLGDPKLGNLDLSLEGSKQRALKELAVQGQECSEAKSSSDCSMCIGESACGFKSNPNGGNPVVVTLSRALTRSGIDGRAELLEELASRLPESELVEEPLAS
jgi:hypothetical protein